MEQNYGLRLALRGIVLGLSLALLCYGLPLCYSLASPFFFALWVAALLNPWIAQLEEKFHWKRRHLVLWILLFFALILASLLLIFLPVLWEELSQLGQQWEFLLEEVWAWSQHLQGQVAQFFQRDPSTTASWLEGVKTWLSSQLALALQELSQWIFALPSFLLRFFVFLLATYFIACDYPQYREALESHCNEHWKHWARRVKHSATSAFGGYLKAQIILSTGVFFLMAGGFLWMSLPFSLLLALGIAVLDFIPMIGSGMVLLPWSGLCLLLGDSSQGWKLLAIWLCTAVFRWLLEPKIVGKQTGLSPILSLGSIYVGLQLWGLWGMILAPVLLLVAMNLLPWELFQGTRQDLVLLSKAIQRIFSREKP